MSVAEVWQRYQYTAQVHRGTAGFVYRPLVDVEVGGETETRRFKALIDSGSQVTIIDRAIATLLRIDSTGCERATLSAFGVDTVGFLAPVSIKVAGFDQVFRFNVVFAENLNHNFDIILGQEDFFKNFDVTFKKSEEVFYLKES